MGRRLLLGVGFALALTLTLGAAPALADEAPPPKVAAKSADTRRPIVNRPMVVGLLAAVFLIIGAAAGANDKKS